MGHRLQWNERAGILAPGRDHDDAGVSQGVANIRVGDEPGELEIAENLRLAAEQRLEIARADDGHPHVRQALRQSDDVEHTLLRTQPAEKHDSASLLEARDVRGTRLARVHEVREDGGIDAVGGVNSCHEARDRDERAYARGVHTSMHRSHCGVEELEADARLVRVPHTATCVDRARANHLEVVQRLYNRHVGPGSNNDGRYGQLRIELMRVHDVGAKLVDEALHRGGGLAVP